MIKSIIKVLLMTSLGVAIIILIPDLFLPISSAIDSVIDTDLITVADNLYSSFPVDIMLLLAMQFSTIAIVVIIRWTVGAKK